MTKMTKYTSTIPRAVFVLVKLYFKETYPGCYENNLALCGSELGVKHILFVQFSRGQNKLLNTALENRLKCHLLTSIKWLVTQLRHSSLIPVEVFTSYYRANSFAIQPAVIKNRIKTGAKLLIVIICC